MSEPMVSHDVVAFDLLVERVSQTIRVVQSGQGADEVFAGYHWYPPLAGVAARATPSRPTPARSSTATHADAGRRSCSRYVDDDRRRQPATSSARTSPARAPTTGAGRGAAAGQRDHAGRRPGQAGGQHDHGLGPGGAGAVPRPRARRAGRRLPAGAEARRRRQGRAQGRSAGGSSRPRSSTGRRATSRCRRSSTWRARSWRRCATRCTRRRPGSAACSARSTSTGCWPTRTRSSPRWVQQAVAARPAGAVAAAARDRLTPRGARASGEGPDCRCRGRRRPPGARR